MESTPLPPPRMLEVVIPCRHYRATRTFNVELLGLPVVEEGKHHLFMELSDGIQVGLVWAAYVTPVAEPTAKA